MCVTVIGGAGLVAAKHGDVASASNVAAIIARFMGSTPNTG
jgi:hypothetical protein